MRTWLLRCIVIPKLCTQDASRPTMMPAAMEMPPSPAESAGGMREAVRTGIGRGRVVCLCSYTTARADRSRDHRVLLYEHALTCPLGQTKSYKICLNSRLDPTRTIRFLVNNASIRARSVSYWKTSCSRTRTSQQGAHLRIPRLVSPDLRTP